MSLRLTEGALPQAGCALLVGHREWLRGTVTHPVALRLFRPWLVDAHARARPCGRPRGLPRPAADRRQIVAWARGCRNILPSVGTLRRRGTRQVNRGWPAASSLEAGRAPARPPGVKGQGAAWRPLSLGGARGRVASGMPVA